ncbi:hypothetical protein A2803_04960 [Candidatus Woesebacteria bacterium RIFCSPHIGHO2_01_FULL_44_21]|uniref:Peptidase M16 n=1 Tax=Candidatus Woesebacteria bacterium RIFCSPHIGHO2_01_FULL_44_21 TaxID=1802503 RepID=A0A1F7Z1V1_9BACT|nr:MAG: hypothetical protein A2803_04960 [Candidatus Woesebacteria bacterium RIFCSPHIGHO2_01_FULL_44_21]OGM70002.1 MAG: hypothetical protein A2897_02355 [Candidatus Woesebacteria bacterium RIFCSPLOWO2_01_FULL_44_24b]
MNFKRTVLTNGIRFIHVPVPTLESATFTIWYGVGSRYEREPLAGISHFLEHMAFKGGIKYPSAKAVSEALDAIGAEDNASTGQEYTNYYVRAATSVLPKAVDVLADALLNPALPEREIEKERGVIIEEINMYEDDPKDYVNLLYNNLIFPDNPLGRDIAGSRETVRKITRQDFINFRKTHYQPENIVITVSGGINYEDAFSLADKYVGGLKKSTYHNRYKDFKEHQKSPKVLLKNKKTEQTNLIIGFPGKKHGLPTRYAEGLMGVILGAGMSSRLFREVREKRGLAYSVYAASSHYADTGEFSAYAGVPVAKAQEAIKVILQEFYKLLSTKNGITKKELTKAREFFKGHMALSMESTKWINYFFGNEEIKGGSLKTPEQVFEAIDAVTVDEILAVAADIFKPEKVNLAIVGPYKDSSKFTSVVNSLAI